jgi:hypothetical protein
LSKPKLTKSCTADKEEEEEEEEEENTTSLTQDILLTKLNFASDESFC